MKNAGKHYYFGAFKFDLKMKLTTLLLFVCLFQINANTYSQKTKLTLDLENTSIESILFKKIEIETDFKFFYENSTLDLSREITIKLKKKRIDEVLEVMFRDTNIDFEIIDKQIVLTKKKFDPIKIVQPISNSQSGILNSQMTLIGTVKDENGEPLPGASIVEKGTINGAQTDFEGNFSIEVQDANATLVVSYIGFGTQEISINGRTSISITLSEDTAGLDEVVVVGYTTSEKNKLTTSVAVMKTKEIAEAPYTDIVSGLQGRVPGVVINHSGGAPGSVPSLSIRGGEEPLYVIDGIIATKEQFTNLGPNDIESVSFLKDAASATIFGFGASNGVVQVVTKVGKGKFSVNYNYDSSFTRPIYLPDNVSAPEFFTYARQGYFNSGLVPPTSPTDAQYIEIMAGGSPTDFPATSRKSIYKEVLDLMSPQQRHSLSLSGSTESGTKVYTSLGMFTQDVNIKSSDYGLERYTFQTNISHEFGDTGIGVGANISLQKSTNTNSPNDYNTIFSNIRYFVTRPLYVPGDNQKYYLTGNPLALADPDAGKFTNENNLVNTQLTLSWKVPQIEGLAFRVVGNYRNSNAFVKNWQSNTSGSAQTYDYLGNPLISQTGNAGPSLSESFSRTNSMSLQSFIDYKRTFGGHTIDFTGGYLYTEGVNDFFGAFRRDYVSPAIQQLNQGGLANQSNSGGGSNNSTEGYAATLKYDYNSKYILTLGGRYDGFYGFAPGKKYGFFPSISGAWNIHNESFLQTFLDKVRINELKLHASWGETGTPGGTYSYLSNYNLNTSGYYNGSSYQATVTEGNLPPLGSAPTWQTTKNTDIGMDMLLFDRKLNLGYNWFFYKNTGYLRTPENRYSTPLGIALPLENTDSEFRRGGLEFFASLNGEIGELKYHIGGNLTSIKTFWVKKFDESESSYKNPRTRIAQIVNADNYGGIRLVNNGYYQTTSDIINNPRFNGANQLYPGYISYKDINGDGIIDGNDQIRQNIPTSPLLTYGINFGFSYRAFSLEGLFQGSGKKSIDLGYIWQSQSEGAIYPIRLNTWTPDNRNSEFPLVTQANISNNTTNSDFWLKDAKYLRLKSLSLQYDLIKAGAFKRKGSSSVFSSFNLVLSGTNLLTFSNISKYYIDPEDSSSSLFSYPVSKAYSFGLRIGI